MNILIIYTGGTIGMKQNLATGSLAPFDFSQIENEVPELKKFGFNLDTFSFNPLVDSSEIQPEFWVQLATIIKKNYAKYDGFVILHGTDTMAYTASALSFMLENLGKPVVLTGSQLPIGMIRTDGKENLVSAIEVAAAQHRGSPRVPEVSVFFENQLFRGNRVTKHNAEYFDAFYSYNYPLLAEAGINIKYHANNIHYPNAGESLKVHTQLDANVAILKIFPGIQPSVVNSLLNIEGIRAVVLEAFGSGNAPTLPWFLSALEKAVKRGLIIVNVTQCQEGSVEMTHYDTGILLQKLGIISGYDMTTEAAIAKLMCLLGRYEDVEAVKSQMIQSISGELTPTD